jgi:hypothetical protein
MSSKVVRPGQGQGAGVGFFPDGIFSAAVRDLA